MHYILLKKAILGRFYVDCSSKSTVASLSTLVAYPCLLKREKRHVVNPSEERPFRWPFRTEEAALSSYLHKAHHPLR